MPEAGVREPVYPGVPLHPADELVGLLDDVVRVRPGLGKVVVEPAVLWPPPPLVLPPVEADGGLLDSGGEAVEARVEHLQDVGHRQVLAPGAVAACANTGTSNMGGIKYNNSSRYNKSDYITAAIFLTKYFGGECRKACHRYNIHHDKCVHTKKTNFSR